MPVCEESRATAWRMQRSVAYRDTDDRIAGGGLQLLLGADVSLASDAVIVQQGHHPRQRGEGDVCHAIGLLDVDDGLGHLSNKTQHGVSLSSRQPRKTSSGPRFDRLVLLSLLLMLWILLVCMQQKSVQVCMLFQLISSPNNCSEERLEALNPTQFQLSPLIYMAINLQTNPLNTYFYLQMVILNSPIGQETA